MTDDNPTPPDIAPDAPRPTGRPVYESSLLPTRKRRRFSPWLVVPGLLLVPLAVFYFLVFGPKPRRAVPTAGLVVYASDSGSPGVSHLFAVKADGSDTAPRRLTTGPGADTAPAWTADGNQLAFASSRAGGASQLWLLDADGKNPLQLTRTSGAKSDPAFAPGSNSLLGFLSGASLAVMDAGHGDPSLLLPPPVSSAHQNPNDPDAAANAAAVVAFAWKPAPPPSSGTAAPGLAAVLETSGVQTLALLPDLSAAPRLTQNDQPGGPPLAAADRLSPAWAPDGSRLAMGMLHVQGLPGNQHISVLIQFDGSGAVQKPLIPPVADPAVGPQNPVFSPDGTQIVFEIWRQTDLASRRVLGLFIVDSDGSGTPHILAKGDAGNARFSADGRQVFFLAKRATGRHDLYKINADGTGPVRLSGGDADVSSFALSPQTAAPR